jgi:predicted PurR-regulated permease PerM
MKWIADKYLKFPIFLDLVITSAVWYCAHTVLNRLAISPHFDRSNVLNVISSLIGTCVSLAGFILAALTIIITFKSNLQAKGMEEASNALELILSSKHYDKIVKVYKDAILEFVLAYIVMYASWIWAENLSRKTLVLICAGGIGVTSLCVLRSLLILFGILNMSKFSKSGQNTELRNIE